MFLKFQRSMMESFKKPSFYPEFDHSSLSHKHAPYRVTGLGPAAHSSLPGLTRSGLNGRNQQNKKLICLLIFSIRINKKVKDE